MLKVYQPEDENVGFARSHEQRLDFDRIRLKTLTTDDDLSVLTSIMITGKLTDTFYRLTFLGSMAAIRILDLLP